jgi:hypothetical protein
VFVFQRFVVFAEARQFHIADAQAVPAGFVHIGWADTFEGGADFFFPFVGFAGGVEPAVGGQNEVRFAGNQQAPC